MSLHYLVKLKCLKIALISTLINTSCSLSVVSLWTGLSVSQTSEVVWLYTLRYHAIGFDRFFWLCSFPHAVFTQAHCPRSVKMSPCNRTFCMIGRRVPQHSGCRDTFTGAKPSQCSLSLKPGGRRTATLNQVGICVLPDVRLNGRSRTWNRP